MNLYHTLYAVPVPQTGAGVAATALFKLPRIGVQVTDGFKVPGFAQSTCALTNDEILKRKIIAKIALVRAIVVIGDMVLQGF